MDSTGEVLNNKPNIETLKKVQYSSLQQFIEDINRNFAIIENSPFYKGLPGNPGDEGDPGGQGIRGSITMFVKLSNFNKYFQNSIISASNINIDWLNLKLKNSDDKVKLLQCFDVNTFVHGDIIVLTNTLMLSYNSLTEQLVDTGIAFNEQSQIINNLDKKIEEYVQFYVDNNISIKNLKTIFAGYDTYAKNFGENNSVFITTTITNSSIYAPYIEGVTSTQGTKVNTHRYWGLIDDEFGKDETGTIVFGSMKKYCELLMRTTLTDGNETLTSDYAPGVGNIPAAVFLQDTPNNGIMIGWKDNIGKNLRRFGIIFKNEANELVIQSDAGNDKNTNGADYSSLYLHKDYMRYKKLAKFEDNVEITRDLNVSGNINNKFIRTGLVYAGSNEQIIVGLESPTSRYKNISKVIALENFKNKVIVTDASGLVLSNYIIEKGELNQANLIDNNKITTHVGDSSGNIPEIYNTSVLTTNYFSFLAKKINNLITYISNNFYKKSEFTGGTITETIKLGGNLEVKSGAINGLNINFSGSINMIDADAQKRTLVIDANTGNVTIGKVDTSNVGIFTVRTKDSVFNSSIIKLTNFKNRVVVTDVDGNISNSYSLLTESYPDSFVQKPVVSADTSKILTSLYLKWLVDMIYAKTSNIQDEYYTKPQFSDNSIPNLRLNSSLKVGSTNTPFFIVQQSDKSVIIGNETEKASITFNTSKLIFKNITKSFTETSNNYILSINGDGEVKTLVTDLGAKATSDTKGKIAGGPSKSYEIVTGDNFVTLVNSINSALTQIGQITGGGGDGGSMTDYVLKSSLVDYSINRLLINGYLDVFGTIGLGGEGGGVLVIDKYAGVNAPNEYYASFKEGNVTIGRALFQDTNSSIRPTVEGTRFLSTFNCIVDKEYQPAENLYVIYLDADGGISTAMKSNTPFVNNPKFDANKYLVTFDMLSKIIDSINILKELIGGSGGSGGEFYTKTEMIAGLSINAKFSGKNYNLGDTVYSSGGSTYIGDTSNQYYTYINNDFRLVRTQNCQILSTDSYGQIKSIYSVSTRPTTSNAPEWNIDATLYNGANSLALATTSDLSYLTKTINLMKKKMVDLNNASGGGLNVGDVRNLIFEYMPIGMIIGWNLSKYPIPSGWAICDGSDGRPNLLNKMIKGSNTTGKTGGSNSVNLSVAQLPSHTHTGRTDYDGSHQHWMGLAGEHTHGVSESGDQKPDDSNQIRILESNTDHWAEAGKYYPFACTSNGLHSHDINYGGSHTHTLTTYSTGVGESISVENEYVTLVFIQKMINT